MSNGKRQYRGVGVSEYRGKFTIVIPGEDPESILKSILTPEKLFVIASHSQGEAISKDPRGLPRLLTAFKPKAQGPMAKEEPGHFPQ